MSADGINRQDGMDYDYSFVCSVFLLGVASFEKIPKSDFALPTSPASSIGLGLIIRRAVKTVRVGPPRRAACVASVSCPLPEPDSRMEQSPGHPGLPGRHSSFFATQPLSILQPNMSVHDCTEAGFSLSKSAEEYSIHSVSLDGDEFGIVGISP